MESSTKSQLRSISLPSKLTPNLRKLKTLVPLRSSESSQSTFACLVDLYLSFDELICSSRIQQVNLNHNNKLLVEYVLADSTGLLDSCSNLLEFLSEMKKNLRTLQSAVRRKGIDISGEAHILDYVLYRKKAKKKIVEYLRSLEQMERKTESHTENHHLSMVIGVFREIVTATISVFRALFFSFSGKAKFDKGFSLIGKLMPTTKSQLEIANVADIIDVTLRSLRKSCKNEEGKFIDVQMVMQRLQDLDHQIEAYEVGLDRVFRRLIQIRVSLLNILGN